MKLLILVLLALSSTVESANYSVQLEGDYIIETKNNKTTIKSQPIRFKKLYHFVASHPSEKNPLQTTMLLYTCEYPEIMAAIASVESGFKSTAVGKAGEVSAWQILEWEKGNPSNNKDGLAAAIKVFKEKKIGCSYEDAIQRYNGKGRAAREYKKKVLRKIDQIRKIEV